MKIWVKCSCGRLLTLQSKNESKKETVVTVEPCDECLKREYEAGDEEGYGRGCEDTERGES